MLAGATATPRHRPPLAATRTYPAYPQRAKKVAGGTTTVYVFSGTKVIAEYVNGAAPSSPTREYIYAGSQLLATIEGGATKYHHPDHLSTRVMTDSTGTVVRTFGHYPFGEIWYETGQTDKWKFTSYERDSESLLDYAMFRSYGNRLGRFMTPDPIAGSLLDPQNWNRYSYVVNDPINLTDPLGLFVLCEINCYFQRIAWFEDVGPTAIFTCLTSCIEFPDWFFGGPIPGPGGVEPEPLCGSDGYRDATQQESAAVLSEAQKWANSLYPSGPSGKSGELDSKARPRIDCSHLVWRAINGAGISFKYSQTSNFASNPGVRPLNPNAGETRRVGDIALFSGHVAIVDSPNTVYGTRGSTDKPKSPSSASDRYFKGKPTIFRVRVPCGKG